MLVSLYTEAKVDVTQEIEQRAQQAAQAGADHCALCPISCVTSTLASVYMGLPSCLYLQHLKENLYTQAETDTEAA